MFVEIAAASLATGPTLMMLAGARAWLDRPPRFDDPQPQVWLAVMF